MLESATEGATPHERVSFRRFCVRIKIEFNEKQKFVPSLGDAVPAQNGKDLTRKVGVGRLVSLRSSCHEFVRSISTRSTWMTMNCLRPILTAKRYLEIHASRCIVGLSDEL